MELCVACRSRRCTEYIFNYNYREKLGVIISHLIHADGVFVLVSSAAYIYSRLQNGKDWESRRTQMMIYDLFHAVIPLETGPQIFY